MHHRHHNIHKGPQGGPAVVTRANTVWGTRLLFGTPRNTTSPLHSRGSPNKRGRNQNCMPHPCLLGVQKWAEVLCHPYILGGPQPNKGEQDRKWWSRPCLLSSWSYKTSPEETRRGIAVNAAVRRLGPQNDVLEIGVGKAVGEQCERATDCLTAMGQGQRHCDPTVVCRRPTPRGALGRNAVRWRLVSLRSGPRVCLTTQHLLRGKGRGGGLTPPPLPLGPGFHRGKK